MAETRGRRPRGNYKLKTEVFSTRITADTKAKLEEAAKAKGHSLSQEIEHRLRRSFLEDTRLEDIFGSRRNYGVVCLITSLMRTVNNPFNPDPNADWLDDPYQFDQFKKMVDAVLEAFRPPGDSLLPTKDESMRAIGDLQSMQTVALALWGIKDAPRELPLSSGPQSAAIIRANLGDDVVSRMERPGRGFSQGDAAEHSRREEELRSEEEESRK